MRSFFATLVLCCILFGCGGGSSNTGGPQIAPPGLSGSYTAAAFVTSPDGRLEAVLSELRFDLTTTVIETEEVAYLDGTAGLQSVGFLRPQGTYLLDEFLGLSIPGTQTSSSFVGKVASDLLSYKGEVAGAGGAGEQEAILTDSGGSLTGTWTGGSLKTSAFPGVVNLTLIFGANDLDGTFDFNGTLVDITGGNFTSTQDGRFEGDLAGNVQGNPVTATYKGRVNANRMVMIFQDNQTHVVALTLAR